MSPDQPEKKPAPKSGGRKKGTAKKNNKGDKKNAKSAKKKADNTQQQRQPPRQPSQIDQQPTNATDKKSSPKGGQKNSPRQRPRKPATQKKSAPQPNSKQAAQKKSAQKDSADWGRSEDAGASADAPQQRQDHQQRDRSVFPIVALGGSAGGLEALKEFFETAPSDGGLAYIVITHIPAERTSALPDILSKTTAMPVMEATDRLALEPDHVYVSPPGDHLTIQAGVLRISEPQRDVKLPIDYFLRALAADRGEHAIGIILSGTGTDGTIGLREVKAEGGMAMVQRPDTARFAGMPASAEATGLADHVLPPTEMPPALVAYAGELRNRTRTRTPEKVGQAFPEDQLRQVLTVLRMRTGHDFSTYKRGTICRRLERRMNLHQIQSPRQYAEYLRENAHEAQLLFRELLITVTSFFRDADAFDALVAPLDALIKRREEDHQFRAWVPGCATGEEAYSVAMLVHERTMALHRPLKIQLFATDLDPRAIDTARRGVYPRGIAADVPAKRLNRYFSQDQDTYQINREIRDMVTFATQNVLSDPPFTRLDLIACRNVLIYFDAEQQQRLLPAFHYALRPAGLLMLGTSETIGAFDRLFEPVDTKWKIYRRQAGDPEIQPDLLRVRRSPRPRLDAGTADADERPAKPRAKDTIEQFLLAQFAPRALVVEETGQIVHIHGRVGELLEPPAGAPSHNVLEMAREGLAAPLAAALHRAARQDRVVTRSDVRVKTNGDHLDVSVTVTPIREPSTLRGLLLVTFRPAEQVAAPKKRAVKRSEATDHQEAAELREQLDRSQESLQATVEELESSNEELKSANEELQSMNEELQSTNEELETAKEEAQSLNEELTTVNAELSSKVEELSHANDDMQNLLNSIEVASIFLDEDLRVQRYTEQAREIIHLMPSDVGRPLEDLALHVDYPPLLKDCRHVLRTLERREEEAQTRDNAWLRVRILPYRTCQNVIAGVVVTFQPIDWLKRAEQAATHAREFFAAIVDTVREPLLVLTEDLTVHAANARFLQAFQVTEAEVVEQFVYDLGDGQWDLPELRRLLEEIVPQDASFNDFEVTHTFPRIGRRRFLLNARRLQQADPLPDLILLALEDVT